MENKPKISLILLRTQGTVTAKEIVDEVGITAKLFLDIILNKLVEAGIIEKRGKFQRFCIQ
jgi:GTP-sensing pleiotropic transcriptional regulator CodY